MEWQDLICVLKKTTLASWWETDYREARTAVGGLFTE